MWTNWSIPIPLPTKSQGTYYYLARHSCSPPSRAASGVLQRRGGGGHRAVARRFPLVGFGGFSCSMRTRMAAACTAEKPGHQGATRTTSSSVSLRRRWAARDEDGGGCPWAHTPPAAPTARRLPRPRLTAPPPPTPLLSPASTTSPKARATARAARRLLAEGSTWI